MTKLKSRSAPSRWSLRSSWREIRYRPIASRCRLADLGGAAFYDRLDKAGPDRSNFQTAQHEGGETGRNFFTPWSLGGKGGPVRGCVQGQGGVTCQKKIRLETAGQLGNVVLVICYCRYVHKGNLPCWKEWKGLSAVTIFFRFAEASIIPVSSLTKILQ